MEGVLITGIVFGSLLVMFLVVAFRYPETFERLLGRITSLELTKSGIKIGLIADAVKEKENRDPARAELRSFTRNIPAGRHILWVDDVLANSRAEIQALRGLGLIVDTATTNAEALSYAKSESYDLVVSDIGRSAPEQPKAGLQLPAALRAAGVVSPLAFYVGNAENPTTDNGEPVFDAPTALFGWISKKLTGGG